MASVKRKAVTYERPSKKIKAIEVQDGKEIKSDRTEARKEEKRNAKEKKERLARGSGLVEGQKKAPAKSILQSEEKAFPRGGGNVLTPIERKQIEAQAERDVLFEQETGQKADGQDGDGELYDKPESVPAKKKRRTASTSDGAPKQHGSGIKVSGLSYKTLIAGSVVLGRVTAITERDVALALPNNLTGYVPITAISNRLNSRIKRILDNENAAVSKTDDEDDITLKQLFHIGQWLRATVIATGTDPSEGKSKKHIELCIDPAAVNGSLPEDSVVLNSTIQAAVRSVEDHGLIMDLGLADERVNGFVSKKELGSAYSLDKMQEGQVILCIVTGKSSNGKVLKISPDPSRVSLAFGDKKLPTVSDAPTVNTFLPGTAVEILVTKSGSAGVVGKIMGMLDVTADGIHSHTIGLEDRDATKIYKVGSKAHARIIFAIPGDDGTRRVGVSFLPHALAMVPSLERLPEIAPKALRVQAAELGQLQAMSSVLDAAQITHVSEKKGLYLKFTIKHGREECVATAFGHISQVSDKRIDSLSSTSGPYRIGSEHKIRVIGYSPIDNVYYVSLKQSVLDQPFLRLEDLSVGAVVTGTVDNIIVGSATGQVGILVKLSETIKGLVPEQHISDVQTKHPERKFKEGFPVKCRILSVDTEKRQVRLTLKKQLVDDEIGAVWKDYKHLKPGMESKGTVIKLHPNGAVVQFYGPVRAWLPVAEMSETFIERPDQHFWSGQTVRVTIVSVDSAAQEMKVTCKGSIAFDEGQKQAWNNISGGQLVDGTITEKSGESIVIDLDSGLKGFIRVAHLTDGSLAKAEKEAKRIRVGQKLRSLVVLGRQDRTQTVLLSNKPKLVEDAKSGKLISTFSDVRQGAQVHGFVRSITPDAVYLEFANGVVGLLPKAQIEAERIGKVDFGMHKDSTLNLWVLDVDETGNRFRLTMREQAANVDKNSSSTSDLLIKPVDTSLMSLSDLEPGKVTKACITSIRATQINVRLAENIQGRVDISEVFESWDNIVNKAAPLQSFKQNDIINVKVLGIHDARNHRYLPFSHRQGKTPVFELSAKKSRVEGNDTSLYDLDSVKPGTSHLAFINNHADGCVWVNLSPNVRGRIALMDLSDDVGHLQNVENRFRVGCALLVKVKAVNVSTGRLDLMAKQTDSAVPLALEDLSPGMVLPARVIKSNERAVTVELSEGLICHVPLVELSDDYDQINIAQYRKNDIVRACVIGIDAHNKRAFVSFRPSKVLSSSLPVKDSQIVSIAQVKTGDIVRGFVKKVADNGVFVSLGADVDALVRITDLSDQYIKDWRSICEVDHLVRGRVLSVDADSKRIQLSLKLSHVSDHYEPPLRINDLKVGMTVTGKVRKVEIFGAFIDIDNTQPRLSGLCHRSEVAARCIDDVRKMYSAGDVVKAKVLSVDTEKRKINLGMKASYFAEEADEEDGQSDSSDTESGATNGGVELNESKGGIDIMTELQDASSIQDEVAEDMEFDDNEPLETAHGLRTGGFDWAGDSLDADTTGASHASEPEMSTTRKKKRKPEIKEDLTGELDKNGPQSNSDFERRLLGLSNDSSLWIQYMAFQLQLGEIQQARDIADRALRTINIRETDEKMNIWIARLNLEVAYGDEESVEEVFQSACKLQDPLEMHEKLASIYIDSGEFRKAEDIFERIIGNKNFRASPAVWLNYATFLFNSSKMPEKARILLTRALQSVPTTEHRLLSAKFAALELRSPSGNPERGRTIFEGLMAEWPRWYSGWDMWVDIERSRISSLHEEGEKVEAVQRIRDLFERMIKVPMKKRRAKFVFKKWFEFESREGEDVQEGGKKAPKGSSKDRVTVLAREYVQRLEEKKGEEGAIGDQ